MKLARSVAEAKRLAELLVDRLTLPSLDDARGRHRKPIGDAVFAILLMGLLDLSSRKCSAVLTSADVDSWPISPRTITRYCGDPVVLLVLRDAVYTSAEMARRLGCDGVLDPEPGLDPGTLAESMRARVSALRRAKLPRARTGEVLHRAAAHNMVLFGTKTDPWVYRSETLTPEVEALVEFSKPIGDAVALRDELQRLLVNAQAEVDRLSREFLSKQAALKRSATTVTVQIRAVFEARPTAELRAGDLADLGVVGRPDQIHGALTWLARPRGPLERVSLGLYRLKRTQPAEDDLPPSFMLL